MAFDALRSIFGKGSQEEHPTDRTTLVGPRIPRHSSGWSAMLKHLKETDSLRVLDIGPTSSSSINLLTSLGHSLHMADVVSEAHRVEWPKVVDGEESQTPSKVEAFLEQNMSFGERRFDVVLLWTTLDYLPEELIPSTVARLHSSMNPGGRVLAFFHTKSPEPEFIFYRYHVTQGDTVEMQEAQRLEGCQLHTNRKIEKLFSDYQSCKFFLAKDNVFEVIVTR